MVRSCMKAFLLSFPLKRESRKYVPVYLGIDDTIILLSNLKFTPVERTYMKGEVF